MDKLKSKSPSINERLPSELLSNIMIFALPPFEERWASLDQKWLMQIVYRYIMTLLLTCRLWNSTAISLPNLWTLAVCDHRRSGGKMAALESFETFLIRSKAVMVYALVNMPLESSFPSLIDQNPRGVLAANDVADRLCSLLQIHAYHIRALSFPMTNDPVIWPLDGDWSRLCYLCLSPKPSSLPEETVTVKKLPLLPNLTTVRITRDHRSYPEWIENQVDFSNILELQLENFGIAQVPRILSYCPKLTSLCIRWCSRFRDENVPHIVVPTLRRLRLEVHRGALEAFSLGNHIRHLHVDEPSGLPVLNKTEITDLYTLAVEHCSSLQMLQLLNCVPSLLALDFQHCEDTRILSWLLSEKRDPFEKSHGVHLPRLSLLRLIRMRVGCPHEINVLPKHGTPTETLKDIQQVLLARPAVKFEFVRASHDFEWPSMYLQLTTDYPDRVIIHQSTADIVPIMDFEEFQ